MEDFEALRGLKAMVGKRVQFDEEACEALRKEIAVAEREALADKGVIFFTLPTCGIRLKPDGEEFRD